MCSKLTRLLLLVVVSAIFSVVVGCATQEPPEVPEELIGVWITDDPRFQDRFLKLEKQAIHFGLGGDKASENPVVGVEMELEEAGKAVYRIRFLSPEGVEFRKTLSYDPNQDVIRYKSRPSVVWKRSNVEIRPATEISMDLSRRQEARHPAETDSETPIEAEVGS